MALEIARALASTELDDSLHMSRLLLLLLARAGKSRRSIEGLTKLAKLDFLLRYPNCLERALKAIHANAKTLSIEEFERTTFETKMVRFRYGPWDHRYRRWVALLVSRGLVEVAVLGRTVHVRPTAKGEDVARALGDQGALKALYERAQLVSTRFGGRSGTDLKAFVYATFPELTNMKWGEEIKI